MSSLMSSKEMSRRAVDGVGWSGSGATAEVSAGSADTATAGSARGGAAGDPHPLRQKVRQKAATSTVNRWLAYKGILKVVEHATVYARCAHGADDKPASDLGESGREIDAL